MSTPDEYAQKYMEGGASIASSRMRMPNWFFALMGILIVWSTVASVTAYVAAHAIAALLPLFLTVPLLVATTLLMSHVRANVTRTHVIIQFGLFGPKIPLERIESVSIEKYDMIRYRGYGLKRSLDGTTAYSVPGGDGRCVRIAYRDEKGDTKKLVVTVEDSTAFAAAIEKARAGAVTGVRVEAAESAREGDAGVVREDAEKSSSRRER